MNPDSFLDYGIIPKGPQEENFTKLSNTQKRLLGLDLKSPMMVDKIDDLRDYPPNIIIARCRKSTGFVQNNFKYQKINKKVSYVMGLGIYQQLVVDKKSGAKILEPSSTKFRNVYRPYRGQSLDGKTLLVWRTGGIGDLGFIQPNLIHLKEKYPTCQIWFACGPQYQAMLDNWDCVDLLLDLPFATSYLMKANYHGLFEGVIERCFEAHTENAYHLFTRWLGLDLPDEKLVPINKVKEEKKTKCIEVLDGWGMKPGDFILMQLRASSPVRTPRPDMWRRVVNVLTARGHNIVITDAPHKKDMVQDFLTLVDHPDKVFNFAPFSETLDFTIALTSLAKLVVATDSALMHIAASLGVTCFGIYGPFPGKIRLTTYKNTDWTDCQAPCAPCFMHGSYPCQHHRDGHGICYDNINLNEMLFKIERLLHGQNNVDSPQQVSDNTQVHPSTS